MNKFLVDKSLISNEIPVLALSIQVEDLKDIDNLDSFVEGEVELCLKKYDEMDPKEIDSISGYRQLHEKYGKKSRKIISAPESLIKLLKKRRNIPRINPLVDIYNLISIKYALALGAHDLDKVNANIILKVSRGGEVFIPLGSSLAEEIYPNEYGYFNDSTNEVLCRLESKQCENTKVSVETKNILMIIQGNEKTSSDLLMEAKNELMHNMNKYFNFNLKEMFEFL